MTTGGIVRMAKPIMIQGTMSNVGKSLLTGGLCRILYEEGYRVAPFKSQNMALNSFITKDGLEMGRAQVMQAEAAHIEPDVSMNPILLKPTNDMGSQVVVNGEVLKTMTAKDYFAFKKKLIPEVMKAYNKLDEKYDIIVIEGAGSPAEINLKTEDIVNMGMAEMADAPVLLVGDIDRGGVFAQLIGTIILLEPKEKARIKGLIINKFRGDVSILEPGIEMLEEKTGIPVVGVIPYLRVDIDDEDSLSDRLNVNNEVAQIDVAVIRTPRISNFTDFNPFSYMEGVSLRYVTSVAELKDPDIIILPGSKNTMGDLAWLRQNGLESAILKSADRGKLIFGICGGYQMLGEKLFDPDFIEEGGEMSGLGLLPMETTFEKTKVRARVKGKFLDNVDGELQKLRGLEFEGYEIHMGISKLKENVKPMTRLSNDEMGIDKFEGAYKDNVCGTYVHGIFDNEQVTKTIIEAICEKKGLKELRTMNFEEYKNKQYTLLAKGVREHIDLKKIKEILGVE